MIIINNYLLITYKMEWYYIALIVYFAITHLIAIVSIIIYRKNTKYVEEKQFLPFIQEPLTKCEMLEIYLGA